MPAQYSPDFDTFTPDLSLSGQQLGDPAPMQWKTNDLNQANYIGRVPRYSEPRTSYWAVLGGLLLSPPSSLEVDLYRVFSLPDSGTGAEFNVDFSISSSAISRPNQDSFSWKFRTADGVPIVSVDFEPYDPATLKLYWTTFDGTQSATTFGIGYDAIYFLNATVSGLGGSSPSFQVSLTDDSGITSPVINATLPGATPSGVGQVAASWLLSGLSPADFGSNSLIFHNYSVVPEPATLAFLGSASAAWVLLHARPRKSRK